MSGFEEIGIAGPDHLREALTNCTDPQQAIEDFQAENGILLPTLQPALPLLDLHSIRRYEFHRSIMEELRQQLIEKCRQLSEIGNKKSYKTIEELLSKCFPLIRVKSVQPVVMEIMKLLPRVPAKYLTVVVDDRELYKAASTEVKRQIWEQNPSLFGDEVSPLLTDYIKSKEAILFGSETINSHMFFSVTPKTRRQGEVVQKLANMVGKSIRLYDMVLQFLRTLFLRTRTVHYCTLRAELLMVLHDMEVHEICTEDPCHKFTWCLDACIREKFVDEKRARELQGFLDGVRRGQEQVLGDLSMILCDPFSIHTIASSSIKVLQHLLNTEKLPRESAVLLLLLRMLALGLGAWDMIDKQVFREPKMENDLVVRFLPSLVSLLADDYTRQINRRIHETEDDPKLKDVPNQLLKSSRKDRIAATLLLYYILYITRQRNKEALSRILPKIIKTESNMSYEDIFLHPFSSQLALMGEDFASETFCNLIFDDFLLASSVQENVLRHSLRLLEYVFHKMPSQRILKLMDKLEPKTEHGQEVRDLYGSVLKKIEAHAPSPAVIPEPLDSPLMSVPTPAPL
ncbi:negative elongation factor B-like [Patiria miniata]|uniref:Negative elongation factor B n=1 Tax=Patiria miniata TaxID=46514 RepID=A0A914AHZ8_PATMI|nr:negative elongation factor B-like [Patiria miniata]